jgi:hypothetical protein
MSSKKEQSKVGRKQKPRGQQTGFVGNPDQNREEMKNTPALRGRRKAASKMFGDESAQQVGTDAAKGRTNTPSLPAALPTNTRLGESNDERAFKQRQKVKARRQK